MLVDTLSPTFRAVPGVPARPYEIHLSADELELVLEALASRASRLEAFARRGRPGSTSERKGAGMRALRLRFSRLWGHAR